MARGRMLTRILPMPSGSHISQNSMILENPRTISSCSLKLGWQGWPEVLC